MNSTGSMDRNSKQYSPINNEEDIPQLSKMVIIHKVKDSTDHKDHCSMLTTTFPIENILVHHADYMSRSCTSSNLNYLYRNYVPSNRTLPSS